MATTKNLNKRATQIFNKIKAMAEKKRNKSIKLESSNGYPLSVEMFFKDDVLGEHWSFCQYGKCNGDLMRDPEIIILFKNGRAIPSYYRNDWIGVEQEYIFKGIDDKPYFIEKQQADLTDFTNDWLINLENYLPLEENLVIVELN